MGRPFADGKPAARGYSRSMERAVERDTRVAGWALKDRAVATDAAWALVIASFASTDVQPGDTEEDWADEVEWAGATIVKLRKLGWDLTRIAP